MTEAAASGMSDSPAKIIIGDDHPLILSALKAAFLEAWPETDIVLCSTHAEVIAAVHACQHQVDIVLLDLFMPGSEGLKGVARLLEAFPTVPVIVISGQVDKETVQSAMALGVSGYLPKSLELDEMTSAVSKVLNGELCPLPAKFVEASEADKVPGAGHPMPKLSERQALILRLIVEGKLNKQIAGEIGLAEQTVKIHITNIFRKLGVRTRTQAAMAAQHFMKPER